MSRFTWVNIFIWLAKGLRIKGSTSFSQKPFGIRTFGWYTIGQQTFDCGRQTIVQQTFYRKQYQFKKHLRNFNNRLGKLQASISSLIGLVSPLVGLMSCRATVVGEQSLFSSIGQLSVRQLSVGQMSARHGFTKLQPKNFL